MIVPKLIQYPWFKTPFLIMFTFENTSRRRDRTVTTFPSEKSRVPPIIYHCLNYSQGPVDEQVCRSAASRPRGGLPDHEGVANEPRGWRPPSLRSRQPRSPRRRLRKPIAIALALSRSGRRQIAPGGRGTPQRGPRRAPRHQQLRSPATRARPRGRGRFPSSATRCLTSRTRTSRSCWNTATATLSS